ncbi:unnamed protein product [Protopolystoma xenopodis]|uniref:Uncharacterized protein n=1 Tax=Protopolystoma xenopodis TaxID=117903 RepID=A0A3S5A513_9PLAT|nr:unnamed protein product [Protopolystoma xenopodis]
MQVLGLSRLKFDTRINNPVVFLSACGHGCAVTWTQALQLQVGGEAADSALFSSFSFSSSNRPVDASKSIVSAREISQPSRHPVPSSGLCWATRSTSQPTE